MICTPDHEASGNRIPKGGPKGIRCIWIVLYAPQGLGHIRILLCSYFDGLEDDGSERLE